jgi:hypothetical protein
MKNVTIILFSAVALVAVLLLVPAGKVKAALPPIICAPAFRTSHHLTPAQLRPMFLSGLFWHPGFARLCHSLVQAP